MYPTVEVNYEHFSLGRLFSKTNGNVAAFVQDQRKAFLRMLRNRRKIICNVDWIIPIHERMFKVTKSMQQRARCVMIERRKLF